MRIRHIVKTASAAGAFALALSAATPALAQYADQPPLPPQPDWNAPQAQSYHMDPQARDAWLADCRQRLSARDNGLGGAAIGGVIGGIAGNRIAGRGDRTVGTIAGAAIGAAAGMAIDKSEDNRRVRDECEAYLDDYYARYQGGYGAYQQGAYGYGHGGYGYGYGGGCCNSGPMMMVPIVRQRMGEPECTETVEYEYIDEPVRRVAPRPRPAPAPVPDKRIRIK